MTHIFDQTLLTHLQIIATLFMAILFLQSGFDKVFNFQGNKGYIKSVFEKTFLNKISTILFITITILEVLAGVFCLAGAGFQFWTGMEDIAILGLLVSLISLLALFIGQRIAKDYAGAASLVGYVVLNLLSLVLFAMKA